MAEQKISSAALLQVRGTQLTYYVKVDAIADTYSVIKATSSEFQNNTGTTLFQIKNASNLKSYTTIPTDNQGAGWNADLIESNGGAKLLEATNKTAIINLQKARLESISDPKLPPLKENTLLGTGTQYLAEGLQKFGSEGLEALGSASANPVVPTVNSRTSVIGGGEVLKYPIDMDTSQQDYLEIRVYQYSPGGLPGVNQAAPGPASRSLDFTEENSVRKETVKEIIQIPIPNAIRDENSVSWGPEQMTSTDGLASRAIIGPLLNGANGDNILENLGKDALGLVGGAAASAGEAIGSKFIRRRYIANKIAGAVSGLGINVDVNQAITRVGGVVENPNLELLFNGPALRTFQFTLRFTPRSARESKRVRQIIRTLKERSSVKKGVALGGLNVLGDNLLLGTPDVFKLYYIRAGSRTTIKGLNKFKTCALTNVSVDYSGEAGRWAAYAADSQPITTLVTLGFAELTPIYDTDYIGGFADDDVAF